MEIEARRYIENAIRRIRSSEISSESGSHLAGVVGKAAQKYERLMRQNFDHVLRGCHVDHDSQIRPHIKGKTLLSKLTLGQIAIGFEILNNISPICFHKHLLDNVREQSFIEMVKSINKKWITTFRSDSTVVAKRLLLISSIFDRAVDVPQSRVNLPAARGHHGITPIFSSLQSGNISLSSSRYMRL
jgi:hypothetical protein